jgi:hypothetical protein
MSVVVIFRCWVLAFGDASHCMSCDLRRCQRPGSGLGQERPTGTILGRLWSETVVIAAVSDHT